MSQISDFMNLDERSEALRSVVESCARPMLETAKAREMKMCELARKCEEQRSTIFSNDNDVSTSSPSKAQSLVEKLRRLDGVREQWRHASHDAEDAAAETAETQMEFDKMTAQLRKQFEETILEARERLTTSAIATQTHTGNIWRVASGMVFNIDRQRMAVVDAVASEARRLDTTDVVAARALRADVATLVDVPTASISSPAQSPVGGVADFGAISRKRTRE